VEVQPNHKRKNFWKMLGPGITTGAADDDPSGIATYSQVGAARGLGLIWVSLFSLPLLGVVQDMTARIGLVTGVGLAKNIKRHYSKTILYLCAFMLLVANVFNIGADLGAMAKATELIIPGAPFAPLVIFFALLSLALQVFIPYKKYSQYLKYLTIVLFVYVFSAFSIKADWWSVMNHTINPEFHFSFDEVLLLCAVLGTTISPYLFFWQTSQEVEEEILHGEKTEKMRRASTTPEMVRDMRVDVWSGAIVSNVVAFFIIATCALTLFPNGVFEITTAADAASAIRPFAGDLAYFLFTVGILGTGLLAIPVLAGSASYAISEAFGWKEGLYHKPKGARAFYGIIALSMVLGILLNFVGLDPIKSLFYSAVLNGIVAPFILFFILKLSDNDKVMGQFKNKPFTRFIGWLTFFVMAVVGLFTIYSFFI
ncbi:MAG: NRAMP family divalent metal transporter, partial [Candidatus Paceibacteria bacterium]